MLYSSVFKLPGHFMSSGSCLGGQKASCVGDSGGGTPQGRGSPHQGRNLGSSQNPPHTPHIHIPLKSFKAWHFIYTLKLQTNVWHLSWLCFRSMSDIWVGFVLDPLHRGVPHRCLLAGWIWPWGDFPHHYGPRRRGCGGECGRRGHLRTTRYITLHLYNQICTLLTSVKPGL